MKILSLSTVYPTPAEPGRGLFVRTRLQHMGRKTEIKVAAPIANCWGEIPARRQDGAIEVLHPRWFYVPGTGALTPMFLAAQLMSYVRRIRGEFPFDVVDSHFGYPDGIAAALVASALRVPFSITLRGSELLHERYGLRRLQMGWAIRRAGRVIAVSEQLRQFAIGLGADPARVRKIPNGVDGNLFRLRDRLSARAKYDLPEGRKVVLTAGHLIELKGHHRAIRGIKTLVDEGLPVLLAIAGGPPGKGVPSYAGEIQRLIGELKLENHVRLLGQVPPEALAELMSAADVFCLASSREGWPNVVHEALAAGTPAIANKVGAVPELLACEADGIVVNSDTPEQLADALRRAFRTEWDRTAISERARRRSWENVAAETLHELDQLQSEEWSQRCLLQRG